MWWTILIIVVVALIVWYVVRKKSSKQQESNPLEKYLNQEAVVTESISDTLGTGKIKIDDQEIQAKKGSPGVIRVGTKVSITGAGNNEVTVKPM